MCIIIKYNTFFAAIPHYMNDLVNQHFVFCDKLLVIKVNAIDRLIFFTKLAIIINYM